MIRIKPSMDYAAVTAYLPAGDYRQDLFLEAWDDESLLMILRFKPLGEVAEIRDIMAVAETPWAVLDGIIRTALFQMADLGATQARVTVADETYRDYFRGHGFTEEEDNSLLHPAYIDEFFKPCAGCGGHDS